MKHTIYSKAQLIWEPIRSTSSFGRKTWSEWQGVKFGVIGICNTIISNLILQLLLLIPLAPFWLCALTGQLLNGCTGYVAYGKLVFNSKNLRQASLQQRFIICQMCLWSLNWNLIEVCYRTTGNRHISALIPIPLLAALSYLIQKKLIFKQK